MTKDTINSFNQAEVPDSEPERQYYFIEKARLLATEQSLRLNRKLTYHIQTFGCQMNFKDSEKLAGVLEAIGYVEQEDEKADFVLYNTCTVRENANSRVYGRIGYLGKLKSKNPSMLIALCGCMMQEECSIEKIKTSYHFVDLIFGTHNIYKLAELIYELLLKKKEAAQSKHPKHSILIDVWKDTDKIVEELPSKLKYSFKAGVNIMFGCNNFCSYCIVLYVRGRERSRKPEDILKEVQDLADHGVKEVMLLGQNVNSYGKNLEHPVSFAELLKQVATVKGIDRIRFMTSHPKDLSDELITAMRDTPKVCNHIHLPVQSGSSRILKIMNRHYTKETYLELINKLRAAMPDIAITTDIIVGFPGETEEDFLETIDICEKVQYDSAFTFIYSKRTGTPAAKMPDQIPDDVIKERFDRLLKVVGDSSEKQAAKLTGKILPVLVEEPDRDCPRMLTGRLENNLLVHFEGPNELIGSITNIRLTECKGFYFYGEEVK